jgi:hypothetical protein
MRCFHDRETNLGGKIVYFPYLCNLLTCSGLGDALVSRKDVYQASHIAGTLDVGLPAERIDTGGRFSDLAAEQA